MEALRESWTDERLDDMRAEMRDGFKRVDAQFERVDEEFRRVRSEMKAGFDKVDARLYSIQRTMTWFTGSLCVSLVTLLGTVVLTQA